MLYLQRQACYLHSAFQQRWSLTLLLRPATTDTRALLLSSKLIRKQIVHLAAFDKCVWGCSNLRVVTEVARSLEFSDTVANLADRVIHGMTMAGKYEYNAVHLRIEKDARDWSQIMGGEQVTPLPPCLVVLDACLCVLV